MEHWTRRRQYDDDGAESQRILKATLKRLLGYLKPRRSKLIAVFFAAILSTVFAIVGPKIMGTAITELFEGAYGKFKGVPGAGIDFEKIGANTAAACWAICVQQPV